MGNLESPISCRVKVSNKMDRAKVILRMKRISENLIDAYKWILREIAMGPSEDAVKFSEELEALLNKYEVKKRI